MLEEVNDPFEKVSQLDLSNGRLATPRKFQQLPHNTRNAVDLRAYNLYVVSQFLRAARAAQQKLRAATDNIKRRAVSCATRRQLSDRS